MSLITSHSFGGTTFGVPPYAGFEETGSIAQRDFVTGFEQEEDVIGRPVDVAEGPDGAIYISDDYSGSIYRVIYHETGRLGEQAQVGYSHRVSGGSPAIAGR